jgi:hypothetical protein
MGKLIGARCEMTVGSSARTEETGSPSRREALPAEPS